MKVSIRWPAGPPAPVYSPLEAYVGKGIVGGRITSGFLQGESAAEQVLRILSGEPVSNVPVITTGVNPDIFDFRQVKKYNLPISSLPTRSIIRFQPPPLVNGRSILMVAMIAGALVVILALSLGILFLFRRQQTLINGKTELDNRLKEKNRPVEIDHPKA